MENQNKNSKAESKKKKAKVRVFAKKKSSKNSEKDFIQNLREKYETIDVDSIRSFTDLPLSPNTLKGLKANRYSEPTDIQRQTLSLSLQGKDILGAAKTGSGKTLAFLIPILEDLFCKQWTKLDGVGALVITPTRELAYQIFETLRKIGEHHEFSAGLIIGGKDLKFERNRMDQCNIIIGTPGRILQHMDENPLFNCVNLQILVLDEADRCLDMGFEQTMNAIIANLPQKRQTMLFSATQTRSVKDLARLSLKDPCYVSVHENAKFSTPEGLEQSYVVCELKDKVPIIWSFIKNHLKQKIIIFLSSCKQVKYIYEIFCKLRPGASLLALYGTLHQLKRMEIYESFCRKSSAVLFATDLAARGLDFPEVHWVVQADCPEDSATYIHRVGRTARYCRGGESLLLLLHSEVQMVSELEERKIPITQIEINPAKLNNPVRKMEAYLASSPTLKASAQRAFVSYVKSVFLMKNKKIFDVQALDTESFAKSLGLAIPPRIRFLQRLNKTVTKINKEKLEEDENKTDISFTPQLESNDSGVSEDESLGEVNNKSLHNNNTISTMNEKSVPFHVSDNDESDDDGGGILKVKRQDHDIELPTEFELEQNLANKGKKKKAVTKAAVAKKILKKKILPNKKIMFTDEGEVVVQGSKDKKSELAQQYENEDTGGIDIEKAKLVLKEEDKFDKQLFKEKVKAMHKEKKKKLKAKKKEQEGEQDEFGESDEEEPDLSWLPDPDKIYGTEKENDEVIEDKIQVKREKGQSKKKRKQKNAEEPEPTAKRKKIKEISSKLSVNEAEQLAMMLLNK